MLLLQAVFLSLTSLFRLSDAATRTSKPIPLYLDQMLQAGRKVYDKQSTPTSHLGLPTLVNLSMYIEGLSSFRTQTMDFQLDVYFQQWWKDERLAHNESSRILIRDDAILNRMWKTDIYFANARTSQFHQVTQPNFLLWIETDGTVLYDCRISMVVMCMMHLAKWPLDSQECSLRILSYAYDISQVRINWKDVEPISRNMDIAMSDMHIVDLLPGWCDGNYSTGEWSCVTAIFYVKREMTHHFMQSYVPTTLIVVISWFSFWLDVEAVPARVSLAITTLLTLSTQANAARTALPEVSYMKAIDVWMGTCMLFVFGVMIEFTIVNYAQRQGQPGDEPEADNNGSDTGSGIGQAARDLMDKALNRKHLPKQMLEVEVDPAERILLRSLTMENPRFAYQQIGGIDRSPGGGFSNTEFDSVIDCSSPFSFRGGRRRPMENGKAGSSQASPNLQPDDRWRQREAERLANWTKSVPTPTTAHEEQRRRRVSSLFSRLASSASAADFDANRSERAKDKWVRGQTQKSKKAKGRREAKKIDQRCRWIFPGAFIVFNIGYWTYYLYIA